MANKYLDYEGLKKFKEKLDLEYASIAALVFKGSVEDVAHLPAVNTQPVGSMFNIETACKTTTDFIEGSGHDIQPGENVAVVELTTGYTQVPAAQVTPDKDPKKLGWFESDGAATPTYIPSEDRIADSTKQYFTADLVRKYDVLGGIFDLYDTYLEFGKEMPTNVYEGRTFLYMGDNTFEYNPVTDPITGRPVDLGYYEEVEVYTAVTPVGDEDPSAEGWFESDGLVPPTYTLSADTSVDPLKTYYEKTIEYQLTADITAVSGKTYYTKDAVLKTGVVYEYDATATEWVEKSGGSASDFVAITNAEIDELFI